MALYYVLNKSETGALTSVGAGMRVKLNLGM